MLVLTAKINKTEKIEDQDYFVITHKGETLKMILKTSDASSPRAAFDAPDSFDIYISTPKRRKDNPDGRRKK